MYSKTRCIVLRTVKYGDSKLIVDLLSRENGRISAIWNVSASKKARARRQYFQPMMVLNVELELSPRSAMAHLMEAHIATAYSSIPLDGNKMAISFFLAEFLQYATRDLRFDAILYDFTEQSMIWLDTSSKGIANFHLMFMLRISTFLGFQPDLNSYQEGSLFDLREGTFCTAIPLHNDYLKAEDTKKMQTLMRMSASNLHLFPLSRNERNRIIDFILIYYRLHIPQFGEMKSLEVLREL